MASRVGTGHSRVFIRVKPVALTSQSVPGTVRWSFLLFVFTIPFEDADVGLMSGSLSLAKISGLLFFTVYFFYHNPLMSKRSFPRVPKPMWFFLGYVAVYVAHGLFLPQELLMTFATRLVTLSQLIILFWISSDLLKETQMARSALWTFSVASVLLAVGSLLHGIETTQLGHGRETALEYNAGTLGVLMALSLIILIGLHLGRTSKTTVLNHVMLLVLSVPVLKLMLNTGSRGALATLISGCLVYLLPSLNLRMRVTAIIIGFVVVGGSLFMAVRNPEYSERWKQTYYEGNVSGRDQIYSAAIEMAAERPILGWQPVVNWYELGSRLGRAQRDAHSLFLHLILEVGFVGAIPFLIGLWLCTRSAWKGRIGSLGGLSLALMVAALVSNVTDTYIARKPIWLVFALTLAAVPSALRREAIIVRGDAKRL